MPDQPTSEAVKVLHKQLVDLLEEGVKAGEGALKSLEDIHPHAWREVDSEAHTRLLCWVTVTRQLVKRLKTE